TTIHDWASGKVVARLKHGGKVHALAFSPDGKSLATAGEAREGGESAGGEGGLWGGGAGEMTATLENKGKGGDVRAVCFSPDGKSLATAQETVWLWAMKAAGKE